MQSFLGKTVWLTGASSGIGEALAYELASRGARLVLSARRLPRLQAVQARCERPERHLVLAFDMTHGPALGVQVERVRAHAGNIDMLINNAGVSQRSLVEDTDLGVDRSLFETDYFGPVSLVKHVLPHMLTRGEGHVVAVASLAGLVATPYRSSYSAAKAALIAFHDALRAETAKRGIVVTVLCPGFVKTEIAESALTGNGSQSAGKHPQQAGVMSAALFARRAVDALEREQSLAVIGGRESLVWWLARLSPKLANLAVARARVV